MAKTPRPTGESRGKLRVFFAEFDGDDATIQAGLHAISLAVSKTFQPNVVVKYLPSTPATFEEGAEQESQEEEELHLEDSLSREVAAVQRPIRQKEKPPTLSLVKELNLHQKGIQSFREFFADKKPHSQPEQVAVCVYYLRKICDINGVTANHVYTCLKDVSQRIPSNLPKIIRNCSSGKGWVDSKDSKAIDITTSGENLVEHDLPHVARLGK